MAFTDGRLRSTRGICDNKGKVHWWMPCAEGPLVGEKVKICGKDGLYIAKSIERNSVPNNLFVYGILGIGGTEGKLFLSTLSDIIPQGTVITKERIPLLHGKSFGTENSFRILKSEDVKFTGEETTLEEWVNGRDICTDG